MSIDEELVNGVRISLLTAGLVHTELIRTPIRKLSFRPSDDNLVHTSCGVVDPSDAHDPNSDSLCLIRWSNGLLPHRWCYPFLGLCVDHR